MLSQFESLEVVLLLTVFLVALLLKFSVAKSGDALNSCLVLLIRFHAWRFKQKLFSRLKTCSHDLRAGTLEQLYRMDWLLDDLKNKPCSDRA